MCLNHVLNLNIGVSFVKTVAEEHRENLFLSRDETRATVCESTPFKLTGG